MGDALVGCLLGTAVGDSIGLCCEGLSRQRQARLCPEIAGHRFLFHRGMVSDDTEHTCMTAQALLAAGGEPAAFATVLAWRLRFWLLGLPAGIGFGTLRAILKLWLGFPPHRSGVHSAGNGPAMRSAIIGVGYGGDGDVLHELIRASTRITHTDPRAECGALAVALAAYLSGSRLGATIAPDEYLRQLSALLAGKHEAEELLPLVRAAAESVCAGQTTEAFAEQLGLADGVSGYIYHTVPVALQCWLRHQADYRSGILAIVRCGGDTDTTAAIVGGIIGAGVGKAGIPQDWLDGLWEWPRSVEWMERLGRAVAESRTLGTSQQAPPLPRWGLAVRNVVFLLAVLAHGVRRLFPPY
ncbi:MAG: ADP-ribosylglycohydrolase family protein [Armatimonadota bacterium]|nr:MAG: ADP-ribosylglycohydrolase family protein [Armatimonadota bacterium]